MRERQTATLTDNPVCEPSGAVALAQKLKGGHREALDELTALLYDELREIAHRHRIGRDDASLVTTSIVHEAYLKLANLEELRWNDRPHFLALAAVAMRHILADRAKARIAAKRGGTRVAVSFDESLIASDDDPSALLQVDDALTRLEGVDPRLARIFECRFFGGLTNEEIAEVLGVTVRTIERDWTKARMLLRDELLS
jgi:RNA polymerase sigma factor (TIGR02999 family)